MQIQHIYPKCFEISKWIPCSNKKSYKQVKLYCLLYFSKSKKDKNILSRTLFLTYLRIYIYTHVCVCVCVCIHGHVRSKENKHTNKTRINWIVNEQRQALLFIHVYIKGLIGKSLLIYTNIFVCIIFIRHWTYLWVHLFNSFTIHKWKLT